MSPPPGGRCHGGPVAPVIPRVCSIGAGSVCTTIPPMSVIVGYVPDATGLLALHEARQQAQWRRVELVVVHAGGAAGYVRPTAADEQNLDAVAEQLTAQGVRFSIRQAEQ